MAFLYCRTRTRTPTWIWTPNLMATLYCTETSHCMDADSHSDPDLSPCPAIHISHNSNQYTVANSPLMIVTDYQADRVPLL